MARARSAASKTGAKEATVAKSTAKKGASAKKATTTRAKAQTTKASAERTVHAESDGVEIVSQGGKWFVASKRRPDLGDEEVSLEQAAAVVNRRAHLFTVNYGLAGGAAFDALV